MAKAKTAETTADALGAAAEQSADAIRSTLEKASAGFEKLGAFHKANSEAFVASAGISTKAMEKVGSELAAYAKSAAEDFSEATKAILTSKSLQTAFETQSSYLKSSYESYMSEMTKLGEMLTGAAREAFEPLQSRGQAFTTIFQAAA